MSKAYHVYGDYGFTSETELHSTTDLAAAKSWASKYAAGEDAGGYDIIEVAWFAADGTYETEWVWRREAEEREAA